MLNSSLVFTGEKLNETINQVKEAKDQVSLAHNESLLIYRDVFALNIPVVDLNMIKENTVDFIKNVIHCLAYFSIFFCSRINSFLYSQANENRDRTEKLFSDNRSLLTDVNNQLSSAEGLLNGAVIQQQTAEELLNEVQGAHGRAEEAVKLGDKTLEEAQQTYATLSGTAATVSIILEQINTIV